MSMIKGLYFIWDKSPQTPYLEAISLSEENLILMIPLLENRIRDSHQDGTLDGQIVVRNVELYTVKKNFDNGLLFGKSLSYNSISSNDFIEGKTFAMNHFEGDMVNNVLIKILDDHEYDPRSIEYKNFVEEIRKFPFFEKNNFSANPVELDMYYDEGTLNA